MDSVFKRITHSSNSVHSLAAVALGMQIASVFFFSGIFKLIPEWMNQGDSLYFTFSLTSFAKPIAQGLLSHPHILSVVAPLIVIFEILVPLCIFLPIKRARICALLLMATFSCVLMVLMSLGPFPVVILCGLVSLVPSEAYDIFGKSVTSKNYTPPLDSKYSKYMKHASQSFLLFCTLFVFVLNTYQAYSGRWPNGYFKLAAEALALNQRWHMFSPVIRDESHLIIEGVFSDGTALDMSTKRKVDWNFPKSPDKYYVTDRWHHYIPTLSNATYQRLVPPLGQAMCIQGSYDDKNPIRFIRIFLIRKITMPPGTSPSIARYNLGAVLCEKHK